MARSGAEKAQEKAQGEKSRYEAIAVVRGNREQNYARAAARAGAVAGAPKPDLRPNNMKTEPAPSSIDLVLERYIGVEEQKSRTEEKKALQEMRMAKVAEMQSFMAMRKDYPADHPMLRQIDIMIANVSEEIILLQAQAQAQAHAQAQAQAQGQTPPLTPQVQAAGGAIFFTPPVTPRQATAPCSGGSSGSPVLHSRAVEPCEVVTQLFT